MSITNITYIKSLPSLILHDHSRLRCLASIKQTRTKLHFTPCGSLHATTPLCVVKKKERKKKKRLNESHESLFAKNSPFEGAIIRILARKCDSCLLRRTDDPRQLRSLKGCWSASREGEGGWQRNIDTVKFNGLIYDRHKSSVTSHATQVSRILLSPRSTLALLPTLPSIFTRSARFSFCPPFFVETGERAGIINGEEINCWRAIRRRFVWSVHDARFTAWIETRINHKAKDIEEFKRS